MAKYKEAIYTGLLSHLKQVSAKEINNNVGYRNIFLFQKQN